MSFEYHFVLPEALPRFIKEGHVSAARHIAEDEKNPRLQHMSREELLAERFRKYHLCFCTASRNNLISPSLKDEQLNGHLLESLTPDDRRRNFEIMVQSAAALCWIGAELHVLPDQETILKIMDRPLSPMHKTFLDGASQPAVFGRNFYENHIQGVPHPRLDTCVDEVMSSSVIPEERTPEALTQARDFFKLMFVNPTANPVIVPSRSGSSQCMPKAAAAPHLS